MSNSVWPLLSILKSRDIPLPTNVHLVKAMFFPVVMYGCESWNVKKAERRRIDAFELWCWRRLESPLDCKEIQPVHPKENQSWRFIDRTDVEAETLILWPPDAKNWLIVKWRKTSLSAIRVLSSAYLRLLIFLLAILIPASDDPVYHFTWCTLHIS